MEGVRRQIQPSTLRISLFNPAEQVSKNPSFLLHESRVGFTRNILRHGTYAFRSIYNDTM